jgi:TPR repeat protein
VGGSATAVPPSGPTSTQGKFAMGRTFVSALVAMLVLISAAVAGPFEDAVDAFLRGDGTTAMRVLRPLADQGDANAQFMLSTLYYAGVGVPQNYNEAVKWARRAADQGYADAQFGLGVMYQNGEGVAQNYVEATRWYRRAADQGNADAQNSLGKGASRRSVASRSTSISGRRSASAGAPPASTTTMSSNA